MRKVFVVVLNWNGGEILANCLRSLKGIKTGGMDLEIVVVDNGSTDNSLKLIEDFKFKIEDSHLRLKILRKFYFLKFSILNVNLQF